MTNIREQIRTKSVIATLFASRSNGVQTTKWDNCIPDLVNAVHTFSPNISKTCWRHLDGDVQSSRVTEVTFTSLNEFSLRDLQKAPTIELFETKHQVQVNFQVNHVFRRHKRLAVFDMDSTLIQQEVIDEIARQLGVEAQVSAITERAMNGELDFTASLRERCALLRGVSSNVFDDLKTVITLSPGAAELVRALKALGFKTAVLSGGFSPLTSWQAQQLGLDYAHANHLVVHEDGNSLTGEVVGVIVDALKKKELLEEIALENSIDLDQVVAIGDGANDLPMMWAAGLGVAFNAKERVQKLAPVRLNSGSLLDVLYLFGLTTEEIQQLLSLSDS
jgi:phosphoserine phosphatase